LREGDVIVGFDGKPTASIDDLHRLLTEERVGKRTRLQLLRRTQKLELFVTPSEAHS
jgi:S1-C subfamily serine protease